MSLEIQGKVIKILDKQEGEGRNGKWEKQEFVIETNGQYPKSVCFNTWGDKTSMIAGLTIGDNVTVSFDPQSREFNDKWYTDLRAWRIQKQGAEQTNNMPPPPAAEDVPPPPAEEDLPF